MLKKRNVIVFSLLSLSAFILFNFQNCAPPSGQPPAGVARGEVRIVEDWSKAELQFIAPDVAIHDEAKETEVYGFCNRQYDGRRLNYMVWSDKVTETPLFQGQSTCVSGQFALRLKDLNDLVCGVPHLLVVEGDWGGSAYSHFTKRCQPLVSERVATPSGSPYGTVCEMEYTATEGDELNLTCHRVCYRDQKVVSSEVVDASQCQSIAAKLAGQ